MSDLRNKTEEVGSARNSITGPDGQKKISKPFFKGGEAPSRDKIISEALKVFHFLNDG